MEKGFYHPDQGYWQTIGTPSAAILDSYPAGTVEVPLMPAEGKIWNGSAWADDPDYVAPPTNNLTPSEFEYLLDVSGLDDAWTALAAYLKSTDRVAYANLQAERRKSVFRLDYTLEQVAIFRPVLSGQSYDISDLTDANITARWNEIIAGRSS